MFSVMVFEVAPNPSTIEPTAAFPTAGIALLAVGALLVIAVVRVLMTAIRVQLTALVGLVASAFRLLIYAAVAVLLVIGVLLSGRDGPSDDGRLPTEPTEVAVARC